MITVTKRRKERVMSRVGRAENEGLFLLLRRTQLHWDSHVVPWVHGFHSTLTVHLLGISDLQEVCLSFMN